MNIYADSKRILDDQDLCHYLNSSYDTKKPINVVITETHLEAYIPHTYIWLHCIVAKIINQKRMNIKEKIIEV